jgi:hypothetical protein|tara:strand:- start:92 stop:511 length:420 start_codon:yes stop_codon:yes gene_type:complete
MTTSVSIEKSISPAQLIGYIGLVAVLCAVSFHGVIELGLEAEDQAYIGDAGHVLDGMGTLFSTGRTYAGRPVAEVVFVAIQALCGPSLVAHHVTVVMLHFYASLLTAWILVELGIPLHLRWQQECCLRSRFHTTRLSIG